VSERLVCRAELFVWEGEAAWHFVRLTADVADEVRGLSGPPRGFGSVRVEARIGATTWRTSVFPDKASGSYLLPVKKAVREAEGLEAGDEVTVELGVEPGPEEGRA
jgi:hypothetical protein